MLVSAADTAVAGTLAEDTLADSDFEHQDRIGCSSVVVVVQVARTCWSVTQHGESAIKETPD